MRSWRIAQNKKKSAPITARIFINIQLRVRLPHLYNRAQTSNKAHDRSLPHLVLIRFRLTTPLSQAPLLGQDELTRRKRDLDTRGLSVRLHTFTFQQSQTLACLSANLFPSNFDSKAIWHFSASRFGCCRNPN